MLPVGNYRGQPRSDGDDSDGDTVGTDGDDRGMAMSEFGDGAGSAWTPPGQSEVPSVPEPFAGNATWPGSPAPPGSGQAPTGGFSGPPAPLPGGPRSPRSGLRTALIIGATLVVVFVAFAALIGMLLPSEDEMYGGDYEEFRPAPSIDLDTPPIVTNPPEDAEQSLAAIRELEQFIFTPGADPTEWESRFTDPAGLREKIEPYASTLCAVGVQTVVIEVRFLDELHAEVDYVFVGPNIPEIGRTFVFTGRVRREPGGPWLAEPGGVEQVAALATGYCLQQDVTARDGLEDDTEEKGTHDTGELVDPLDP